MTAAAKSDLGASTADRELVAVREFAAPRDLVFRTWSDPQHLARWWGPRGFATTTHRMDFRPGGVWRLDMHGPDGRVYPNKITYVEIAEPERIVYDHGGDEVDKVIAAHFRVTVTFEDLGGRTRLTMRMVFPSAEERDKIVRIYGADKGLQETLDRLVEHVGELAGAKAPEAPRKVVITRTFDAPRRLVFEAWTDSKHLARWWGPHGFTNPVCEVDARPGGKILIHMAGPDGSVFPMTGEFVEVVPPERLVYRAAPSWKVGAPPFAEMKQVVTFAESGGKTTITIEIDVLSASPEAAPALAGMETGWSHSLDRLDALVGSSEMEESKAFVLTRTFDAPRDTVYKAWTEADRLATWFGPKGFTTISTVLDLRPCGVFHYGLKSPDGNEIWGRWIFREVTPPERLVFVMSFSDRCLGVTRHPMAPDWPRELLSIVEFREDGGKTTIALRALPIHATEAERATFDAARDSMKQGWGGTFERLEAYLAGR